MEKMVDKIAKTVDEAVEEALKELNASREDVDIEVLEEPTKGLLGIGAKPALVRVKIKENLSKNENNNVKMDFVSDEEKKEKVTEVLNNIVNTMGLNIKTDIKEEPEAIKVNIDGENLGLIIGHKGENLDALQLLTSVIVNKEGEYKRIELDVQNYREKRKETLIHLAQRKAKDVIRYGRNITLEPMTPYERRIIHTALQEDEKVTTVSVGTEPFRKVVIKKR